LAKPRSILVNYSGDEENLLRAIGEVVGQSLTTESLDVGAVHRGRALDVAFSLIGGHGLVVDDYGIEFTKYEYQLMLTPFEVGLRVAALDAMYENLAMFMAERLTSRLHCETLVVENLQRAVATFQP
jgi:hypothetical protein